MAASATVCLVCESPETMCAPVRGSIIDTELISSSLFFSAWGRGQSLATLGYLVDCMTFEDN